jgi:Glycosyl transferase family 2
MAGEVRPPLVSVLIACWNAEDSIERAIRSVLDDRSIAVECVVVDDASSDRTAEIVEGLATNDSRIVLVRQPENRGVSAARNRGLELVRGEWLTLLDADDRFVGAGLAALVRVGEDRNARAVVGQQVWTDGRRRWITDLYDIPDIRLPRRTSLAASPGLLWFVSPHAKVFRRELVAELRFEGRVLGDQPWIVRGLLRAGDAIEVVGDTVYEWWRPTKAERSKAGSITASTRSSANRGVEAAVVAVGALRTVIDEAERQIPDIAGRTMVGATYLERLLRSDLAAHLEGALARRDRATGELLGGIRDFVVAVPPDLPARTDALARDILEPVGRGWPWLDAPAKAAATALFAAAVAADPGIWRRGSDPLARTGLGVLLARDQPGPFRRAAATVLLLADGLVRGLVTKTRRARRAVEGTLPGAR